MIRYHHVTKKSPRFRRILELGSHRGYDESFYCTAAVVATDSGLPVGYWKFMRQGKTIVSCCTWVHPSYRCQGIAKGLWRRGVSKYRPKKIRVTTVSKDGRHLVNSLRSTLNAEVIECH